LEGFWNSGFPAFLTLIGVIVSAIYGPKTVAKIQGKQKIEEIRTEGDANAETLYVQNMSVLLTEYKEQVAGFRNELTVVREEFALFKEQHNKEVLEYENKIAFLEIEIEHKDDRIEELETVVISKDSIIATLKGDI